VLLVVPKVVVVANVTALFPALMTADPLVLLILDPELVMRVPVPSALALLMFRTAAPLMLTPPDAPELSPLKVNVPADAVVNPAYVLFPARVISPVPTLVRALLAATPLIAEPIVILPVPPIEFAVLLRAKVDPVTVAAVALLLTRNPEAPS
jgi:hypothetical protein